MSKVRRATTAKSAEDAIMRQHASCAQCMADSYVHAARWTKKDSKGVDLLTAAMKNRIQ